MKSILAVLAGIAVAIGLALLTDMFMQTTHVFPVFGEPMSDVQCAIATAYRIAYGMLGGYVAAQLAPVRRMQHSMVSGVLVMMARIVGVMTTWDAMPSLGPRWYGLALVAIALPCVWVGAKVHERVRPRG